MDAERARKEGDQRLRGTSPGVEQKASLFPEVHGLIDYNGTLNVSSHTDPLDRAGEECDVPRSFVRNLQRLNDQYNLHLHVVSYFGRADEREREQNMRKHLALAVARFGEFFEDTEVVFKKFGRAHWSGAWGEYFIGKDELCFRRGYKLVEDDSSEVIDACDDIGLGVFKIDPRARTNDPYASITHPTVDAVCEQLKTLLLNDPNILQRTIKAPYRNWALEHRKGKGKGKGKSKEPARSAVRY